MCPDRRGGVTGNDTLPLGLGKHLAGTVYCLSHTQPRTQPHTDRHAHTHTHTHTHTQPRTQPHTDRHARTHTHNNTFLKHRSTNIGRHVLSPVFQANAMK